MLGGEKLPSKVTPIINQRLSNKRSGYQDNRFKQSLGEDPFKRTKKAAKRHSSNGRGGSFSHSGKKITLRGGTVRKKNQKNVQQGIVASWS